ncbi:aldose 1-epimerase [Paenibacillus sp. PL2-23]|uniref:aldose 1-epimerase n=1 Tax=Paenibacillus sp. PL2-23 TaxID=2100729 RepID=UPI0030F9D1F8
MLNIVKSVELGKYHGEEAVYLRYGQYEAVLLPEIGGNLVAFRDIEQGYRFLHEPGKEEMESFKSRPIIHGIPILFPPNRYEDGRFPWDGVTHTLPVNEPATGNHLHGFVYNIPWQLEDYGALPSESFVMVSITIDENHEVYASFPFCFRIELRYGLSGNGLSQRVSVHNLGSRSMPCLLAFHTSVNAPFVDSSSARDYRMKLTIGERWELNDRMLPTGQLQPLQVEEKALQGTGVYPYWQAMDNHYTALPQQGRNRMELTDEKLGVTLVYDVGTSYKKWMIWNNFATEGFFCPEPQVNLVNAPNVRLPAEQIGLFGLEPGEIWEETSRMYVKPAKESSHDGL